LGFAELKRGQAEAYPTNKKKRRQDAQRYKHGPKKETPRLGRGAAFNRDIVPQRYAETALSC